MTEQTVKERGENTKISNQTTPKKVSLRTHCENNTVSTYLIDVNI